MPPAPLAVEQLPPGDLLTNVNISDRRPDDALIESVRDRGVLQPVIATRTVDGAVRVRMGHRRTLAAVHAGLDTIPVIVVADEAGYADDRDGALDRLLDQFDENERRQPLNAADKAAVVTGLLDLGLTARQVTARTRIAPADVDAARAVRRSAAAAAAAAQQPELTLEQAAGIAEFDDDPAIAAALAQAARDGDGRFKHQLQRHRDERELAQQLRELAAKLTADGVTIAEYQPDWANRLDYLTDPDGKKLTPRGHKKCPGHAAYLFTGYGAGNKVTWQASWYCANPKANGHRSTLNGRAASDPEKAKQERRETIARNKEWRAAEKVRRQWLTEFLARKSAPDGALRYILTAIAGGSRPLHRAMSVSHVAARELLGMPAPASKWQQDTAAVTDVLARAADGRALLIVLGLVLGAIEGETDVQITAAPALHGSTAAYLEQLASWGYALSAIEQRVVDAVAEARAAAAAKEGA